MKKPFPSLLRAAAGLLATGLSLTTACSPDKKEDPKPGTPVIPVDTTRTNPADTLRTRLVYVVNEGTSNGSISLFDKAAKTVRRDVYAAANGGQQLGPYVQNMSIVGNYAYLVVNGADSVQVVRLADFRRTAKIGGFSQPRYLVAQGRKAYVTEWLGAYPNYTGRVSVLDLTTNTITKQIAVGNAPDQLLLVDNKLYVTASYGNALTVINTDTDAVETTVPVPDGPKNILRDGSGNLWVLCSKYGAAQDYLVRFAPATPTQQTRIAIASDYSNGNLRTNKAGDKIYVSLGSGTYELAPTAAALPAAPLIRRSFYGLGIDPQDNTLYAGTINFSGDAKMIRYTATGAPIDSFNVGTGPNAFLFR